MGDIGDLIKPNKWHKFDLQTYDTTPYWLAHVYDKDGNMYYVAKILTIERTAYRVQISSEQTWDSSIYPWNPYGILDYQYYRPQRKRTNGSGTFRDWEVSNQTYSNYIHAWASDNENICPPVGFYGAADYDTIPPQWFAGTGGNSCSINPLF